jgi:hypothetical protein
VGFCPHIRSDGIHWDDIRTLEPIAKRGNEGCFNVIWDSLTGEYRGFALGRDGKEEAAIRLGKLASDTVRADGCCAGSPGADD